MIRALPRGLRSILSSPYNRLRAAQVAWNVDERALHHGKLVDGARAWIRRAEAGRGRDDVQIRLGPEP